ncbi:MAG TPA: DUF4870 domain-containing protein [Dehalococcoidia bacterium]|nr:DUF4870 domain-containing protein [Dehalococcoidia bacterium]
MRKTSVGLEENVSGLLCYVAWWISGIIFLLLERENKFVRFHALQSIIAFGILTLAGVVIGWIAWIPFFGWLVSFAFWVCCLAVWIVCMVKAYQGDMYKLPWAGNLAERSL